jgi:tRNA pseudouridine55 synthase
MNIGRYQVNKIELDDFGRPSGVLAVNKPIGLTSHDVVYRVRKALNTKAVGHAGSLDPFASGLLMIIVGKATKLSDEIMAGEKSYIGEILFGIATDTQDPEGDVIASQQELSHVTSENIQKVISQFTNGYDQYVPVYSSIKVDGDKLRVLARKYERFEIVDKGDGKIVNFYQDDQLKRTVELPRHFVELAGLELLNFSNATFPEANEYHQSFRQKLATQNGDLLNLTYPIAKIKADCPKGTYIRQLAVDIGNNLETPTPAMLVSLERTRVGQVQLTDALTIDDLYNLVS